MHRKRKALEDNKVYIKLTNHMNDFFDYKFSESAERCIYPKQLSNRTSIGHFAKQYQIHDYLQLFAWFLGYLEVFGLCAAVLVNASKVKVKLFIIDDKHSFMLEIE